MKVFAALLVLGFALAAGGSAVAQDAFYHYDSNAHSYHNYHYPVDWHGHYYHGWPSTWSHGHAAVVYYEPVYAYHYHHHYHGCCCW